MEINAEIVAVVTLAGVFVGGLIMGIRGYRPQSAPQQPARFDPVLTGIGLEQGSHHQMEALTAEVAGIRRAIETLIEQGEDRRQAEILTTLKAIQSEAAARSDDIHTETGWASDDLCQAWQACNSAAAEITKLRQRIAELERDRRLRH